MLPCLREVCGPEPEVHGYSVANALSEDHEAEEQDSVTGHYYSDGNPAVSEWPETDLLNPG